MDQRERTWPLVVFTVLGPASAGCLLGEAILVSSGAGEGFAKAALSASLLLAGGAVLASLAHLAQPLRAYRALRRFPASPLSREIAAYTLYLALTGLTWLLELLGARAVWLSGLGALAGFAAVSASAQIYLLPARPTWSHWSTVAGFLGSGLSLGLTGALLLAHLSQEGGPSLAGGDTTRALALAGAALTALALTARAAHLRYFNSETRIVWESTTRGHQALWLLRVLVGLVLASLALSLSFRIGSGSWLWVAVGALLLGELADRHLFFASAIPLSFRAGIPPLSTGGESHA